MTGLGDPSWPDDTASSDWWQDVALDLAGADAVLVDARNTRCPEPIRKLRRALAGCAIGQTITILVNDPASEADIPATARILGQVQVSTTRCGDSTAFVIRKQV
jgi:tRNA 2-thiouridine synthesizing protein A